MCIRSGTLTILSRILKNVSMTVVNFWPVVSKLVSVSISASIFCIVESKRQPLPCETVLLERGCVSLGVRVSSAMRSWLG